MSAVHLYALIPLLVMLVLSMIWYGRGLLHLMGLAYVMALAWMALINGWEIMFFPILIFSGIIEIILFIFAITKGDWL